MTRSDLIDRIAAKFPQLQLKDAEESVKTILDALCETLSKGGRAEISRWVERLGGVFPAFPFT
jgi:integration host factor subunit beta